MINKKKIAMILSSTLLIGSIAYGDNSEITVTVYNDTAYSCDAEGGDPNTGLYSISSCEHNNTYSLSNMYVAHMTDGVPNSNVAEVPLGENKSITTESIDHPNQQIGIGIVTSPDKYYIWSGSAYDIKNGENYYAFLVNSSTCSSSDSPDISCFRFTKQNPETLSNNSELSKNKFFQ